MKKILHRRALGMFCVLVLAVSLSSAAWTQQAANQRLTQRDLSSFRSITQETLAIVTNGNLKRAKSRIRDLETDWDRAEPKLRPRNPEQWSNIDKSIDAALQQLRAANPQAAGTKDALQHLLAELDRPTEDAAGKGQTATSANLSITDVIAALATLRAGESVLDVSFEPKDGKPAYAVRTFWNGKVWDGLLDGLAGTVIGDGTVTDEAELDDEDKAEVAASKSAKITLRQAVEAAEKTYNSPALNAGLEQVRGRVVWEVLFRNANHPQIHIDPMTGRIM
jgi:Peptidase propeptide and YPEB domain